MNIPGHAGLTMSAVYALGYLADALAARGQAQSEDAGPWRSRLWTRAQTLPRSVLRLGIDLRLLIFGAWLPDIIDKPLSFWLLPEAVNHSTRSVGHSLLFNAALLAAALAVLGLAGRAWPVALALGSIGHLLLDKMWEIPVILLWPFLGWRFPTGTTSLDEYFLFYIRGALASPWELVGALVLLWFALQLYRRRVLVRFLKTGNAE